MKYLDRIEDRPYLDRYRAYYRIYDATANKAYYESCNQTTIAETPNDLYHTVEISEENRLDKIAALYYNFPTYWWIIAQANNILDPFQVATGTQLRIPSIDALYLSEGPLKLW